MSRNSTWARIGYVLAEGDAHAPYYREVLDHAGLRAEAVESFGDVNSVDVLLLCGYGNVGSTEQVLVDWVKAGGVLIVSGGTWNLRWFRDQRHVSNSSLSPVAGTPVEWIAQVPAIRFLGGTAVSPLSENIAFCADGGMVSAEAVGEGYLLYFGPHVGQTIAQMQGGRAVEIDAVGAPDVRLDDGLLRSEDGIVLNFDLDRQRPEGSDHFLFGYPFSDALREFFIRAILHSMEKTGLRHVMTWHWPNFAVGTAMLTLDCENQEFDYVSRLQRTLTMFGCPATWLVSMPGYPVDAYRHIRAWSHEVGLLFQTDDGLGWHEEKFRIQLKAIGRLSSMPNILSARPVDGKWRGLNTFYDLCQEGGARISLSKGGRQPGTSGFAFGTCHPYFPLKRDGHPYYVLEIPTVSYMPGPLMSDQASDTCIAQTALAHGCFHLVFKPEGIEDPEANASFRRALSICKQHRLEFTTPSAVYAFETARRRVRLQSRKIGSDLTVQVTSDVEITGLTLLVSGSLLDAEIKGREVTIQPVSRYGQRLNMVVIDVPAKQAVELCFRERPLRTEAA